MERQEEEAAQRSSRKTVCSREILMDTFQVGCRNMERHRGRLVNPIETAIGVRPIAFRHGATDYCTLRFGFWPPVQTVNGQM